ncbi:complement factor D [Gouania willdenowi]|nr:complement factor D-like [Gouania willdenowi]
MINSSLPSEPIKTDLLQLGAQSIMASGKDLLLCAAFTFAVLISQGEGIIGGREAAPHSRPYMASIQIPEGDGWRHDCGGFVVGAQWVMTAAHCLTDTPTGRKVLLGAHSLSEAEDTKQTFDANFYKHPNYSESNYDNDIALMKLDRPFTSSDAVQSLVFLRTGGTNPNIDAEVETAGWGSVNDLGSRPDKLKEVTVNIFSSARCRRNDYFGRKFTHNMMCAHKVCPDPCNQPHRKEDSCDGDSGGPLLYNGVAVGITSNGGKKCEQIRKPGIYTIISHYTEWIDQIMNAPEPAEAENPSS